jgi:hypothetical protein
MTSAQEAIATYLQTGGYGTLGSSIFVDFSPSTPFNCIVVTGYQGPPPDRGIGSKLPIVQRPKVQVIVRHSDPSTALTSTMAINNYLEGVAGVISDGVLLVFVLSLGSGAIYLGKDANNLTSYSMNFEVKTT